MEDPELGISVVDMGLIVDARRDGSDGAANGATARVAITYTAMGCPATELIEGDIRARLRRVPGIYEVAREVVWEPVWTKARLTAEARDALLATHVGDEPLNHDHGAPVRLVAPGRRGFQWVKWIVAVELLTAPDFGQAIAIHTSSFTPAGRGE